MARPVKRFLSKIAAALLCWVLIAPGVYAATNIPQGDVGNFGTWATPHNRELFERGLTDDITAFQSEFQTNVLVKDYVPIEAKVGRAFIGALSLISNVLENSLVRFVSIFLIIAYAFWIILEAYQMMREKQDAKKLWEDVLKKGILITIWILIIEQGPAQLFMWIMGPVISIGAYLSDLILNSVAVASGAALPDTCAAIHNYVATNHTGTMLIDASQTADLLCVPTRLSGFFYTAVAAGWQWMLAGIGHSAFTFVAGAVFVVVFMYNIWKFALMTLGIIADLFLTLIMLPFTAIAQTFGGKDSGSDMFSAPMDALGDGGGSTSYKGIPGDIFNGFLKLFKTQSLSAQIQRFIQAAVYFVSLSMIIAVCAAILSGIIDANLAATVPSLTNDNFMVVLIVGCLVAYLANKAGDMAKSIGGSYDDKIGQQIGKDISKVWGNTTKTAKDLWKAVRDDKK